MNTKRKYISSILLLIAIVLLFTHTTALAYQTKGWKITSQLTLVPHVNFSATSVIHMGTAVSRWNIEAGSSLMCISSGAHSTTGYYTDDGMNYIYREDAGSAYVARAATWANSSHQVTQVDFNINTYYSWANSAQPGCYDVFSVFLHETGHPAGLDDLYSSSDTSAVMYGHATTNATKRSLAQDDKNGIAAIY